MFAGFDRFKVCEVYSALAHDYGLYGINARLQGMGYKPRASLRRVSPEWADSYAALEPRAKRTGPWSRKLYPLRCESCGGEINAGTLCSSCETLAAEQQAETDAGR